MAVTEYRLVSRWRVFGTVREVADVFADVRSLARWWPSAFLGIEILEPGDRYGFGTVACVCSRGWLSQLLLWQFGIVEARYPFGFIVEAWGDISGRGNVTIQPDEPWANVTFDWTIRVDHPVLRLMSFAVKPVVQLNHRWVMQSGEEYLSRELARRRAASSEKRSPTAFWTPWPWPITIDDKLPGARSFVEW